MKCVLCLLLSIVSATAAFAQRPHLLLITVDDMNADSVGVFGCRLPETTPTIDAFAKSAMRFDQAYVQVGNCMPGRNVLWSGMYSVSNGVEGFRQNQGARHQHLCDLAKSAGYFSAIRGKANHSTPYYPYPWDADLSNDVQGQPYPIKDIASYGESTRRGFELAAAVGKPLCLNINISDPHKPFYHADDPHVPSKRFLPRDVPVPGFLHASDTVREELADYYNSVRRADDCFASIMKALEQSGQANRTLVLFLSDHGMPLPFAKTQLYHHSTHTPLLIRWPGVTQAGAVDDQHLVSSVDVIPTLVDAMGATHPDPASLQGRSFSRLLRSQPEDGWDDVLLEYNENSGRKRHPMRGLHTREYLYLFNPWSDGVRKFATATTGTRTYREMRTLAATDVTIGQRLKLFDHRVLEELYDIQSDPDCLHNLIDSPTHRERVSQMRSRLIERLEAIDDPVAPVLADVSNAARRKAFMDSQPNFQKQRKAAKK